MHWIWASKPNGDNQATLYAPAMCSSSVGPIPITEYRLNFSTGEPVSLNHLPIVMTRKKDEVGDLTDSLIARGSSGLVVSSRIRNTLERLNIQNIEYHPVSIVDHIANITHNDYSILNVTRIEYAVNHAQSQLHLKPNGSIKFIDKLSLEFDKIFGIHAFRLAEYRQFLLVADFIKEAIEAIEATGVEFIDPNTMTL